MNLLQRGVLLTSFIGLLSIGAFAGSASGTLEVSANVPDPCLVASGGALAFGTYDPTGVNATTDLTQTGTFQMTCTNGTVATILLGQGANPGGASTDASPVRNMLNGSTRLNYQLYTTPAHSTVWNNVTGLSQSANGLAQTITVYGAIPHGQNVIAGSYTDVVVITVNY